MEASKDSIQPAEYQCSICCELLLYPVVGSCGHDFCKHCIEGWLITRQNAGLQPHCPLCRATLLPPVDSSGFGVCIRLRETVEKLFPVQLEARKQALAGRRLGTDLVPGLHSTASPQLSSSSVSVSIISDLSSSVASGPDSTMHDSGTDSPESLSGRNSPTPSTLGALGARALAAEGLPLQAAGPLRGGMATAWLHSYQQHMLSSQQASSLLPYGQAVPMAALSAPAPGLAGLQVLELMAGQYHGLIQQVAGVAGLPMPHATAVTSFLEEVEVATEQPGSCSSGAVVDGSNPAAGQQQPPAAPGSTSSSSNDAVASTNLHALLMRQAESSRIGTSLASGLHAQLAHQASSSHGQAHASALGLSTPSLQAAAALLTSAAAASTAAKQLRSLLATLQSVYSSNPAGGGEAAAASTGVAGGALSMGPGNHGWMPQRALSAMSHGPSTHIWAGSAHGSSSSTPAAAGRAMSAQAAYLQLALHPSSTMCGLLQVQHAAGQLQRAAAQQAQLMASTSNGYMLNQRAQQAALAAAQASSHAYGATSGFLNAGASYAYGAAPPQQMGIRMPMYLMQAMPSSSCSLAALPGHEAGSVQVMQGVQGMHAPGSAAPHRAYPRSHHAHGRR